MILSDQDLVDEIHELAICAQLFIYSSLVGTPLRAIATRTKTYVSDRLCARILLYSLLMRSTNSTQSNAASSRDAGYVTEAAATALPTSPPPRATRVPLMSTRPAPRPKKPRPNRLACLCYYLHVLSFLSPAEQLLSHS